MECRPRMKRKTTAEIKDDLPVNPEAEQSVLGSLLANNNAFDRINAVLDPEHFYEPIHREIYSQASAIIKSGGTANPVTMKGHIPTPENLKLDGKEATAQQYLARLMTVRATSAELSSYVKAVHEAWLKRELVGAGQDLIANVKNLPAGKQTLEAIDPLEEVFTKIRAKAEEETSAIKSAGDIYLESLERSYVRGEVEGVPICLREIGLVISEPCFEAGNLYGLLSSSGEGKTSLMVQQIHYALAKGHPVLLLSYDQSTEQIVRQMVSQVHEIEAKRQRDAKNLLSPAEFEMAKSFSKWIREKPFECVRCSDHGAAKLVSMARSFVKRRANGKVPLIVVDHIGAVVPEDQRVHEGQKAKEIGQTFKTGAVATGAAWLVLLQRNSHGMAREHPRPISRDLYGGDPAKTPFDAIFYLMRYMKYYEERKATASKPSDFTSIERVFPSAVRIDGEDLAEIGAIKIRFGNPFIKQTVKFEARLTRYKADEPAQIQAELLQEFSF